LTVRTLRPNEKKLNFFLAIEGYMAYCVYSSFDSLSIFPRSVVLYDHIGAVAERRKSLADAYRGHKANFKTGNWTSDLGISIYVPVFCPICKSEEMREVEIAVSSKLSQVRFLPRLGLAFWEAVLTPSGFIPVSFTKCGDLALNHFSLNTQTLNTQPVNTQPLNTSGMK
jgi:hypothetical protein